jgi:hypothetical protein
LPPIEYEPFWEEEPIPEPPKLFHKFLHLQVPTWFQTVAQTNSEIISKGQSTKAREEEKGEMLWYCENGEGLCVLLRVATERS